jgi:hypothetical protein
MEENWKRGTKHSYTDRPLTEEEKRFVAGNHCYLFSYMKRHNMDLDEWYDILIIPYLKAVKKYFNYEPCKKYAFSTVLNKVLFTAERNYFRDMNRNKRKFEIAHISLDYMLEGDNRFAEYTSVQIEKALIDNKQAVEQIVLDTEMMSEIINGMTAQQQTIFRFMLEGYTNKEIVEMLATEIDDLNMQIGNIQEVVTRCLSN